MNTKIHFTDFCRIKRTVIEHNSLANCDHVILAQNKTVYATQIRNMLHKYYIPCLAHLTSMRVREQRLVSSELARPESESQLQSGRVRVRGLCVITRGK